MTDNITLPREVVEFVLKHLEWWSDDEPQEKEAIEALRTALAAEQPKQEPVAWMFVNLDGECEQIVFGTPPPDDDSITPLYTAPPEDEALRRENEWLRELLTETRAATWLVVQDNLLDRIDAALRREET